MEGITLFPSLFAENAALGLCMSWIAIIEDGIKINILERRIEVKNIDRIRSMNESELAELLHETPFDCANRCPDFDCGCLRTCTHGAGIDIIREWLETEIAT